MIVKEKFYSKIGFNKPPLLTAKSFKKTFKHD